MFGRRTMILPSLFIAAPRERAPRRVYASVKCFYGWQFYSMRGCRDWLAARSSPLACDFLPNQAGDDVAFGLFGCLQLFELIRRQVELNGFLHQRAQLVRFNGVELDGNFAEVFRSRVAELGRAGRQIPVRDLLWCDRDALESDLGIWCQLAQR